MDKITNGRVKEAGFKNERQVEQSAEPGNDSITPMVVKGGLRMCRIPELEENRYPGLGVVVEIGSDETLEEFEQRILKSAF